MKTPSEALLSEVKREIQRRGLSIRKAAKEMGVLYMTLFYGIFPEKRAYKRLGRPRFTYDLGIRISSWLSKSKQQSVN